MLWDTTSRGLCGRVGEEEEEKVFTRIHGYYRGTQGARCYTDGASLQPDESEGCSHCRRKNFDFLAAHLDGKGALMPQFFFSSCPKSILVVWYPKIWGTRRLVVNF